MLKLLPALSMIGMLAFSPLAMAESPDLDSLSYKERKEKIKEMSAEERKAYFDNRQEQWNAMGKEEKLKVIEERRTERMKRYEEKWQGMSDDEKIEHVEKKMQRWKDKAAKKDGHHDDKDDHGHHGPDHD